MIASSRTRKPSHILVTSIAAVSALVLFKASASAAPGIWAGPGLTGTWDTTDTNWTGVTPGTPWAAQGNTATFNTINNAATVSGSVFADALSLMSSGNSLTVPASQSITLNAGGANVTLGGAGHASSADGNTLTINGTVTYGPTTSASGWLYVGDDSSGGANASGTASSYNSIVINSGGLLQENSSPGGTHNDRVGAASGANYNYVDINGGTWNRDGNQRLYVGASGSYNYMLVRNGGTFTGTTSMASSWGGAGERVLQIGDVSGAASGTGGTANYVDVNGGTARVAQGLIVGNGGTATGNYLKIENGGAVYAASSANANFMIGQTTGADSNYIQVTGSTSLLDMHNAGTVSRVLTIGNVGTTANNNHLDVFSGATANLYCAVILGGSNSAFNLGDGTGTSTANLGNGAQTYLVNLSVANARLNINSGTLVSRINAIPMVTGLGQVVLNGAATFSTPYTNSIDSVITGAGSLTKAGSGTLTISSPSSYTGDTTVFSGTLALTDVTLNGGNGDLASTSNIYLNGDGVPNDGNLTLPAAAVDSVQALYINGIQQSAGIWGALGDFSATYQTAYITAGELNVLSSPAPEPGAAVSLLGGLGMLLGLRRRRSASQLEVVGSFWCPAVAYQRGIIIFIFAVPPTGTAWRARRRRLPLSSNYSLPHSSFAIFSFTNLSQENNFSSP